MPLGSHGFVLCPHLTMQRIHSVSQILPQVMELPVDNIDLELSARDDDLLPLLLEGGTFDRDISFGLVDVHSGEIEAKEVVLERIGQAIEAFSGDRLWFDPDCGLKNRSLEEAQKKLEVVVEAVQEARDAAGE